MQISSEVMAVLSQAQITSASVTLTGQLDRKLYEKTAKVLEACGAKWNRKAKCHMFQTTNAAERIEIALATGEATTAREIGFFPTPDELAAELVAMAGVKHGDRVLEPSAGTGNIVRAIQDAGGIVTACEWDRDRREVLAQNVLKSLDFITNESDFMKCSAPPVLKSPIGNRRSFAPFDRVVMNPPFTKVGLGDHLDHVRHAFGMLKPGGALVSVLPASVEFREDKRHKEFRHWCWERHHTQLNSVGAADSPFDSLPEDSFAASGTKVRTCTVHLVQR